MHDGQILAAIRQLEDICDGDTAEAKKWLNARNRELNDLSPMQVIAEGNVQAVQALLYDLQNVTPD